MRSGSTPSCAIATPPLTDSRYSAISPSRRMKRLMPSITTGFPMKLRDLRRETRQRPRISHLAVEDGIDHFPAIVGRIAVKQVLHHMRDVGTAFMGAVDIVVIDGIFGEMTGETRAVSGFGRQREVLQ